jgi:hypothetical protein
MMPDRPGRAVQWLISSILVALVIGACDASTGDESTTSSPNPSTSSTESAPPTGTSVSSPDHPSIWFGPLPPLPPGSELQLSDGSVDYYDLFAPDAPWSTAEENVDVLLIYASWVRNYATDDQLQTVIDGAKSRGLALAFEVGPLPLPAASECQAGEGYGGVVEVPLLTKIADLGGTVDYIAFDEPYAFGHKLDSEGACQWSFEQVAEGAAEFAEAAREVFPDIVVGSVEPLWGSPAITGSDIGEWMDAYEEAAGEPLAFFHIDVDWTVDEWPEMALGVIDAVRSRGVRVGIIYNGGLGDPGDPWMDLARLRMFEFEQVAGGATDDVIIQSWDDQPDYVLPESDPSALTSLINLYLGERTVVELAGAGNGPADATVHEVSGAPLPGVDVEVEATPLDGQTQTLTTTGVVPEGATTGLVLVRVNLEGAGPGPADMTIQRVSYEEAGENLVPDPEFEGDAWTPHGAGTGEFIESTDGSGRILELTAEPDQELNVDGSSFAVTPGANFTFTVDAGVPEDSGHSGYIAVVFLSDTEIGRVIIPLAPVPIDVGPFQTDGSGVAHIDMDGLTPGACLIRAFYAGDLTRWPSYATQVVGVE